jgi:hypothetical protein
VIVQSPPRILDDDYELPPELKLVAEQAAKNWAQENEEYEATKKARRKHLGLPDSERPLPLTYKPNGGW